VTHKSNKEIEMWCLQKYLNDKIDLTDYMTIGNVHKTSCFV